MSAQKRSSDVVDCNNSRRGVWLVKVPKYLSEIWENNPGGDVGKVVSTGGNINFVSSIASTSESIFNGNTGLTSQASSSKLAPPPSEILPIGRKKTGATEMPKVHEFRMTDVQSQTLAILSEDKSHLHEDATVRSGNLSIEGRVVKRAECRPNKDDPNYMGMKVNQIQRVSQPKHHVKQIDKAVVKFKPTAIHAETLSKVKAKKEGIKTVRLDRDVLREAIFHAFEKHQYYRLMDLQKLTNQPANYVKEILMEIANYNTMPPHKSMWELKPEYRSYKTEVKTEFKSEY
uniref:General transcription factor IIF subunit 2 n=1 Tax=Acrobeloides nanus TaxID=290746 RepID=A0A914DT90_9BILA